MSEEVRRTIEVEGTPEEVWRSLTDPEELAAWLADAADMDLRPGGEVRVRVDGEEREGWVEVVEPPRRLCFWWGEEPTRVEFVLAPCGDGATAVTVVESRPLARLDISGIELGGGSASPGPLLLAGVGG